MPLIFHVRAREFLDAADMVSVHGSKFSPRFIAFLYRRAVELSLKAYLLACGDSVEQVERFRHNLKRLLRAVHARGFDGVIALSPDDSNVLLAVGADYPDSTLSYPELSTSIIGLSPQPDTRALAALTRRIHDAVQHGCLDAVQGDWRPPGLDADARG